MQKRGQVFDCYLKGCTTALCWANERREAASLVSEGAALVHVVGFAGTGAPVPQPKSKILRSELLFGKF